MAGEASPLIQKLMQIVGDNPAALRELLPVEGEAAARIPTEELSGPDVTDLMTRVRGRLAEWLGSRAEGQPGPFSKPAASMIRAQGPTAVSPGQPAMPKAPSPARPLQMDIMDRLPSYEGPSGSASATLRPDRPEPADLALAQSQEIPPSPPTMAQGPGMTSVGEMLRRPQGAERSELISRVQDLLQQRKAAMGQLMSTKGPNREALSDVRSASAGLQRIKPSLMPPGDVDPRTTEGLRAMGAIPEAEYPTPSEDQPVDIIPYRGAPKKGTYGRSEFERLKESGLKKTSLPPEMVEQLKQYVASGQLPEETLGSANAMRDVLAEMYGYKPRALVGSQKVVGEAAPSRTGLMLKQMAGLSPEETARVMGSIRPSGIMRQGQQAVRAEEAAPLYQALGEKRDPKEIVADLLRGGPSPDLQGGEFARNVLYPIARARQKAKLFSGEPLTLEQVLGALRGSRFLRSDQPQPAREALVAKVLEMARKRGMR